RRWLAQKISLESIAVSPDGKWLASGGPDEVVLWHPHTGKLHKRLAATGKVHSVAFNHDGDLVSAAGYGTSMHSWRVATGDMLPKMVISRESGYPQLSPGCEFAVYLQTYDDERSSSTLFWISTRTAQKIGTSDTYVPGNFNLLSSI